MNQINTERRKESSKAIFNMKKAMMEELRKDTEEFIKNAENCFNETWVIDPDDHHICARRDKEGKPKVYTWIHTWDLDEIALIESTFDEFLDESETSYMEGEDGWGEDFICDMEILKSKIEDRIEKMKKQISLEL
jgi:hypothetical protein